MTDAQRAVEFERILHIVVHELRSPLGVAQGYAQLLVGQTLSAADRDRAQERMGHALSHLSRLVDAAATLLEPGSDAAGTNDAATSARVRRSGLVDVSQLCARVTSELARYGVQVIARDVRTGAPTGIMTNVGGSLDQLCEAVATILSPTPPMRLDVSMDDCRLSMTVCRDDSDTVSPDAGDDLVPFDPWSFGRLEHLVAHRRIALLNGRVWCRIGETRARCVTLVVESEDV